MTVEIKFHDPVYTSDGHKIGVAQRLYLKPENTELDPEPYEAHLMVFDFEVGDDLYIPTNLLAGRSKDGGVALSISLKSLEAQSLSRTPRYIAYEVAQTTELPK